MIEHLLFDFDGVILDSMPIREWGFHQIYADTAPDLVAQLIEYHRANGGLSRYVKIRWFIENVLKRETSADEVAALARRFSSITRERLCNRDLLIEPTMDFIDAVHGQYHLHVVSGSDGEELREVCQRLGIARFFLSIEGSPTPKVELVRGVLRRHHYDPSRTALVGDSRNDWDAARDNGIKFVGFNNDALESVAHVYVRDYSSDLLPLLNHAPGAGT